jgi:hypothetical protein
MPRSVYEMHWSIGSIAGMALGCLVLGACDEGGVLTPEQSGAGSGGAPATCEIAIAPAALQGCRAPDEPGCETCYVFHTDGTCSAYSTFGRRPDDSGYNTGILTTDCPTDGARCASCTPEAEAALCRNTPPSDCDCSIDAGIDPCFAPSSCGCYCSAYSADRQACPAPD